MATFLLILEVIGGIILLFAFGWLISHLLKLEHKFELMQKAKDRKDLEI
jgi:hypothetical protein